MLVVFQFTTKRSLSCVGPYHVPICLHITEQPITSQRCRGKSKDGQQGRGQTLPYLLMAQNGTRHVPTELPCLSRQRVGFLHAEPVMQRNCCHGQDCCIVSRRGRKPQLSTDSLEHRPVFIPRHRGKPCHRGRFISTTGSSQKQRSGGSG